MFCGFQFTIFYDRLYTEQVLQTKTAATSWTYLTQTRISLTSNYSRTHFSTFIERFLNGLEISSIFNLIGKTRVNCHSSRFASKNLGYLTNIVKLSIMQNELICLAWEPLQKNVTFNSQHGK